MGGISHMHYRTNVEYLESTLKTLVFDIWFAEIGSAPNTNKYSDFIQVSCVVSRMINVIYNIQN